jgi:hypothetical protein
VAHAEMNCERRMSAQKMFDRLARYYI